MTMQKDTLVDDDFTGNELDEGEWIRAVEREGTHKHHYVAGDTSFNSRHGNFYMSLVDDAGNEITGELRYVVYHSDRFDEKKHIGDTFDLQRLASADPGDSRTWHDLGPQNVGAKADEVMCLEIKVENAANNGQVVDTDTSDYKVPLLRRRA